MVKQTYLNVDYTYKENGVIKTIKDGFFVPIFSNHGSPIGNARNDSNIDKMKEINKIIETNPYSYIFDGGYITAPDSLSGTYKERIVVTHKKPSLNNAAAFMGKTAAELISKKKLAIEFWKSLTWNGMPDNLNPLSETPSPDTP